MIHTPVCTMFSTDILVLLDSVCYRNHEKANLCLCIVEPKYKDDQLVGNKLNKVQHKCVCYLSHLHWYTYKASVKVYSTACINHLLLSCESPEGTLASEAEQKCVKTKIMLVQ